MSTKVQRAVRARVNEMLAERGIPSVAESPNWPEPECVPVLSITVKVIHGRSAYQRAADAAAASFDMDAAQARWAAWDRVLADVLEPGDVPALDPVLMND